MSMTRMDYIQRLAKSYDDPIYYGSAKKEQGSHPSIFKGNGLVLKDLRSYEYGDDVKNIHWCSYAKTQHLYVKTYEQEQQMKFTVILDCSNTMLWGFENISKLLVGIEIIYLLYFICEKRNDVLEVHLWDEKIHQLSPLKGISGIKALQNLLKKIQRINSQGKIDYYPKKYRQDPMGNRDFVHFFDFKTPLIVLSDFLQFLPLGVLNKVLSYNKGLCVHLTSPLDKMEKRDYAWGNVPRNSIKEKNKLINNDDFKKWGIASIDVSENYLQKILMYLAA